MNVTKIKIIGAGGIGSYLIEPLCRYLEYSEKKCEITVIDGDKFEEKNRERQKFTSLNNKAQETVSQISHFFNKIHLKSCPEFVTSDNIITTIRENDEVFLCVDNHATRKLVSQRCSQLKNVSLISGGNDLIDGNVICYLRRNGKDITQSPIDLHQKIANPDDVNPGDEIKENLEGCQAQISSTPQLLFTNLAVASTMLNCYRRVEQNNVDFDQVYLDINTMRSRTSPELY